MNSNTNISPNLSRHAEERSRQRKFSPTEISYVMEHGRRVYRTGICFYFLAARDVPLADHRLPWVQRLIGATILFNAEQTEIITLYKNAHALHNIKKKSKNRH